MIFIILNYVYVVKNKKEYNIDIYFLNDVKLILILVF